MEQHAFQHSSTPAAATNARATPIEGLRMKGQLSRPPVVTPWGKCDTRLQGLVPETVALDFRKAATLAGASESELLRNLVLRHLYGDKVVEASLIEQYRSMVGIEPAETVEGQAAR